MKRDQIFIVSNFHYDVAYLKTYDEYLPMCFRNITEALSIMEEYEEFCFLLEQTILLEEYWDAYPEKRELLQRFSSEGRLAVAPGMYVMPDMNHPDGESLFLQMRFGKKWLKEHLNLDSTVCWIADCWGHHAQLPQILQKSGYEYYTFYRTMNRGFKKNDFVWQGLDGTEIKTHWLAKSYSGLTFPSDVEAINVLDLDLNAAGREKINSLIEELKKFGDDNDDVFLLCNGGDFLYPQRSAPPIIRELRNTYPELSGLKFATPETIYNQIDWTKKERFSGEFNSSFQGTFTTNIHIKQSTRYMVNRLLALEALSVTINQKCAFSKIWKLVLKQQSHDTICGTICDGAYIDNGKDIQEAEDMTDKVMTQFEDVSLPLSLFNPHSFNVHDVFEIDGKRIEIGLKPFSITPLSEGRILFDKEEYPVTPCSFENRYYSVSFDKQGYITSLKDKSSGEELIESTPCRPGSLCLQMDYGDPWLNFVSPLNGGCAESTLEQNAPDPFNRHKVESLHNDSTRIASIEKASVVASSSGDLIIKQQGSIGYWEINIPFTTTIHCKKHSPRIDYMTRMMPNNKHYRIRVAFPTAIHKGAIKHEIPYGIQERLEGEHVAQNWMDYSDKNKGLALLNKGIPANNVTDDIMFLTLFRAVAMEYKAESKLSFNEGIPQEFHYSLMPHHTDDYVSVIRQAMSLNKSPLFCRLNPDKEHFAGWSIDSDNTIISCVRWSGSEIFVRLYEAVGKKTDATLTVPCGFSSYSLSDGLENAIEPPRSCDKSIPLCFNSFEVKNLLFKPVGI